MKTINDYAELVKAKHALNMTIAPVEDGANIAGSYTSGKQFIREGVLYTALTTIAANTAWSSLTLDTDYEVADDVSTQIAAVNQTLTNKVANMQGVNLLYNPWFTVNQRNATSATAGQFIADRWRFQDASAHTGNIATRSGNNITLKTYSNDGLVQIFDGNYLVEGESYTISAKINGVIYKKTISFPMSAAGNYDGSDKYFCFAGYVGGGAGNIGIYPYLTFANAEITATVSCVKLEKGTVSTLAMDKEPNYAMELAKCRTCVSVEIDEYANQGQVNVGTPNRNLLDNPWFTVNQRGITSWSNESAGYSADRWAHDGSATGNITNGVYTCNVPTYQKWEDDRITPLLGKTVTLSWLLSDGSIGFETKTLPSALTSEYVLPFTNNYVGLALKSGNSSQAARINADVAVKAVKLELGTVSTLAMDAAPNYAEELLKCMWYFQRLKPDNVWGWVGFGNSWSGTTFQGIVPLPAPIRTGATKSYTGNIQWYDGSATKNISSLTLAQICGVTMQFAGSAPSDVTYTQGSGGLICQSGSYIDISADL